MRSIARIPERTPPTQGEGRRNGTETLADSSEPPNGAWQEFLIRLWTSSPDSSGGVHTLPPDRFDEYAEAWQGLLDQLGAPRLPTSGAPAREWREFLNQLRAAP